MTTPEHRAFLDSVRSWCINEVEPRADSIDHDRKFFGDLLEAAADLGLQGMLFDDDFRVDLTHFPLASASAIVVSEYSGAVALGISIARLHAYLLARYAHPSLAAEWVPRLASGRVRGSFAISEPDAGTDIRAVATVAHETANGYRISGRKAWITQGSEADFAIVLAKVGSADRKAPMAAFVVPADAPGFSVGPPEDISGFRGMPTNTLVLDDVVVPSDARLEGDGFAVMLDGVNLSRIDAASYAVGFMQAALDRGTAYANERIAFGSPISDLQAIQLKLGRLATDLAAARALLERAEASFAGDGPTDHILIAQAKVFASDAAMEHTTQHVQILGANGLHREYGAERLMRDAKVTQIFDGTSEVLLSTIGRSVARSRR